MINKRIKLVILVLLITSVSYTQNCDVTNNIDSLGLKQGLWTELEAKPDIISITHYDLDDGSSRDKFNYDYNEYTVLKYEGCYKDGLRNGEWKVYSPNDKIRYVITFANGIINGNFKLYYPNGEVKLQGFIDRKQMTTVFYYDKAGVLLKQVDWFTNGLIERLNR